MSDVAMMDYDVISHPIGGQERVEASTVAEIEDQGGEWETSHKVSAGSTTLAKRSLTSRYNPSAEMEGALRVMNHAGRILWRAAMEAIPGGGPSLGVLSKLLQRSFGNWSQKSKGNTDKRILPFSFGRFQAKTPDENHAFSIDRPHEEAGEDEAMEAISDSSNFSDSFEASDEILSQPKKRKSIFAISSLLPSSVVVSDSEEEEDDDNLRPSKRARRGFEREPLVPCW